MNPTKARRRRSTVTSKLFAVTRIVALAVSVPLVVAVACSNSQTEQPEPTLPAPEPTTPAPEPTLPAATPAPAGRARVAFVSYTGDGPGIMIVREDGSLPFQITTEPIFELNPFDWSPDGTRLAFASANGADVYVYAGAFDMKQLTTSPFGDNSPKWSPDGQKIAFRSARSGNYEVWVMNADGSDQTQLSNANVLVNTLAWSPDARFIAFTATAGDLYLIGADGSGLRQLTKGRVVNSAPAWSSDSQTILFSATAGAGLFNIFSVGMDGSEPRQLTVDSEGGGSSPVLSPDGTRVAFTAGTDRDIFAMNADGSHRERLTADPGDDANPSWSADGEWIVFDTDREGTGDREIYVMRADGSGLKRFTEGGGYKAQQAAWAPNSIPRDDLYTTPQPSIPGHPPTPRPGVTSTIDEPGLIRLTDNLIRDSDPTWSPDGKRIAYLSGSAPGYRIWTMNADGLGARMLSSQGVDGSLAWSPDGATIAFAAFDNGNFDVYTISIDGSRVMRLTDELYSEYHPAWSPDGSLLAFVSRGRICTMKPDGSDQSCLTDGFTDDAPSWSPDGKRIAFSSTRYGWHEIFVMDADGARQTRLTANPGADRDPEWSPDGRYIAFVSERDGRWDLYAMEPDGSRQTRLTNGTLDVFTFAWSPDGRRISFAAYYRGSVEIFVMEYGGSP